MIKPRIVRLDNEQYIKAKKKSIEENKTFSMYIRLLIMKDLEETKQKTNNTHS